MSSYRATVHREGDWWVIDVDGVGATQAKRLDKVEHMARDLVVSMLDVPADDVAIAVTFDLKPELARTLKEAAEAAEAAKAAQKRASQLAQVAVTRLQHEHWSIRDIARVTGVSFQRVHQVLNEAIAAGRAIAQAQTQAGVDAVRAPKVPPVERHATQAEAVAAARKRVHGTKTPAKDRASV